MDTIKLWARNGEAVRQAVELGELAHIETASEELTDEFRLFAIQSGLLSKWADAFPDPRCAPARLATGREGTGRGRRGGGACPAGVSPARGVV